MGLNHARIVLLEPDRLLSEHPQAREHLITVSSVRVVTSSP